MIVKNENVNNPPYLQQYRILIIALSFSVTCSIMLLQSCYVPNPTATNGYIQFTAVVTSDFKLLDSYKVSIYVDGSWLKNISAEDTFQIHLAYQKKYEILITKSGYFPNKIEFNTHAPARKDDRLYDYIVRVNMVDSIKGMSGDNQNFDAKLGYDRDRGEFAFVKSN